MRTRMRYLLFGIIAFLVTACLLTYSKAAGDDINAKDKRDKYEDLKKKDVRDYTDADLERLYDQWEEDEEDLPEDELPEHLRPKPQVDFSKFDAENPESLLKESKRGQTLMMFVTVSGNPAQKETEKITSLWQGSLFNAHYDLQRYVVGENRVLFVLKDGSKAWEVKDYLVKQDRCEEVTIEGKSYPGVGSKSKAKTEL